MSTEESPPRSKRGRSARYPGVPLSDSVDLCRFLEERGLDGLTAADIASALGYTNIKTNTFSARLSSARQFGLLRLQEEGYALTPLARAILHPVDPAELPRLRRQALLQPPLYAELAQRFADKKLPEPTILANLLYHHFQIMPTAKQAAAEAFLESARFADALDDSGTFRPQGLGSPAIPIETTEPTTTLAASPLSPKPRPTSTIRPGEVRLDLRLWDADQGKVIRLRAPESITPASFERFLQAFRLHVRIAEPSEDP
jgi:hypothetical protein